MKVVIQAPAVDKDGNSLAVGQEVDLDDETANLLRSEGKASLPYDPNAQPEGVYNARSGRAGDAAPPPAKNPEPLNAPESEKPKK